jgi:hypothetical protein
MPPFYLSAQALSIPIIFQNDPLPKLGPKGAKKMKIKMEASIESASPELLLRYQVET